MCWTEIGVEDGLRGGDVSDGRRLEGVLVGHVLAEPDAQLVQHDQGEHHHHHAGRIGGREHHRDDRDDQNGDTSFLPKGLGIENRESIEEEHHQWQLEADSKEQRQHHGKGDPLGESNLWSDTKPVVEPQQEGQHKREDQEKAEENEKQAIQDAIEKTQRTIQDATENIAPPTFEEE